MSRDLYSGLGNNPAKTMDRGCIEGNPAELNSQKEPAQPEGHNSCTVDDGDWRSGTLASMTGAAGGGAVPKIMA
ncbi:hypothetical protein NDU88_002737 [Pleurodeles waltl]|uniref:Uncharacterized protein n=1 Tax=Pleurodeles waltl TaxID=8319 RepID=A0AAV7T3D4_PLEWA|nr:hypothetical protein NDU88_002737 [Pleurodeles waltl]